MPKPNQPHEKAATAELIIKLIALAVGAGMGALIGGVFLFPFVNGFFGPIEHLRLYCTLGAGLLGGLSSYSKAAKQMRRQRLTSQAAEELGLDHSADDDSNLEEALSEIFSGGDHLSVGNVMRKDIGSAQVAIADLHRMRSSSHGSSRRSHSTTRTIAYFESPELDWPAFTLQPEGMATNLLSRLTGVEDIDFAEFQEFSDGYYLTGRRPDLVRQLFTPDLLSYFTENHGMEVRADGNRLVLVRPGEACPPDELQSFLESATDVFTQLVKASVQTRSARAEAEANAPSPTVAAEQMTGVVGQMIRRVLVTPDQLEAFLKEMPPRRAPANIKRRRMSSGSLVAAIVGLLFFLAGSVFAVYSIFYADGEWNDDRIVPLVFGIVFPLVGLPMFLLTSRYRYINGRLLRHGIVVDAVVLEVAKTGTKINDQQQYRMHVRFDVPMGAQQTHCNIYGRRGREAGQLAKSNQTTRILYDPRNPRRVLWADSLLMESVI